MTTCHNENLVTKIVSNKLVFSHWHLGKPSAIKLVVDAIYIIGSEQESTHS